MMKRLRHITGTIAVMIFAAMLTIEAMAADSGWKQDDKGWQMQADDGTYFKDTWAVVDGSYYHFNKDGYRDTGWLDDHGRWYYLGEDGRMYANAAVNIDGYGYTFGPDGVWCGNFVPCIYPGTWQGNTFINTWSDYKITVPDDYSILSLKSMRDAELQVYGPDYKSTENNSLMELLIQSPDRSQLRVYYRTSGGYETIDLDEMEQALIEVSKEFGMQAVHRDPVTVGGYSYNRITASSAKSNYKSDLYIRKVGNEFMLMEAIYIDGNDGPITDLINSITPASGS